MYNSQGVIGFTQGSNTYTYRKNLFGDIVAIYNGATKVAEYAYDAWGNHVVYDPQTNTYPTSTTFIGNINPIRYRGYFYDVETGLYYCNNRYYSPEWNRFVNASSTSSLDSTRINGLNLYTYSQNNPINNPHLPQNLFNKNNNIVNLNKAPFSQYSIHFPTVPSWLDEAITFVDLGFSFSQVAIILSYTTKNGELNNLLMAAIGAKKYAGYLGFVDRISPLLILLQTAVDISYNLQQGYDTQYVINSAAYTLVTGFIAWGAALLTNAAIAAKYGAAAGGVAGFIVGLAFSIIFTLIKETIVA